MGKLVRDHIPALMRASSCAVNARVLGHTDFRLALRQKLVEEAIEVGGASSRDEVIEELADTFEVLRTLAASEGIALSEVLEVAELKRVAKGAFEARIWLDDA